MKKVLISGLILLCLSVTPAPASMELTMERAIELGLTHNEELLTARENRESAHERVREARGAMFPNVEASYGYNRYFQIPTVAVDVAVAPDQAPDGSLLGIDGRNPPGPDNPLSWHLVTQDYPLMRDNEHVFGLTASQVLYSSGRIMNYYRSAKSGSAAAESFYNHQARRLILQIQESYLNVILAGESLAIARASLENTQKDHDLVEKKYNQGLASEFDLMQHQVELHTRRIKLMTAENAGTMAGNYLKAQIGIPYEAKIVLTDAFNDSFPSFKFNDLKQKMLKTEPSLKASHETVRANEHMLRAVKADYYPIISAFGSAQRAGHSDDFIPQSEEFDNTVMAGLQISIPLYEGGVKTARKNQAVRNLNKSRLELSGIRKMLVLDLQNSFLAYQTSQRELETARETVALAEKAYQLAQLRYETGLGSLSELRDAELGVTQARLMQSRITRDANLNLYKIVSYISDDARSEQ